MATGRQEELHLSLEELEKLETALKDAEFRKLLLEYCEEVQSPENQLKYQKEYTEMEKQRGHIVKFLNPTPGYVVKTSSRDTKTFINICSNASLQPPSVSGAQVLLPHAITPSKDHKDSSGRKCIVYDALFHPDTLSLASRNASFQKLLTKTACEAVQQTHKISLDLTNLKYPKSTYKGIKVPTVTRKPDPDYVEEQPTIFDDLMYPQKSYPKQQQQERITVQNDEQIPEYAIPNYVLKHSRHIDMKEFTYEKEAKKLSAIPTYIIVEVNLPLLSSTKDVSLDVHEKSLSLVSENPAKYKLELNLPYRVNEETGSAQFDLKKRLLIVTLPVIPSKVGNSWCNHREDSGVESDVNSPCPSDEDNSNSLVSEVSDAPGIEVISESEAYRTSDDSEKHHDDFLESCVSYSFPSYACDVFDNTLVFTFHVKNVVSDSIVSMNRDNDVKLKFNSLGAGYFPIHYALLLKFCSGVNCERPSVEVWDNNVTMQFSIRSCIPVDHYLIGLYGDDMKKEVLEPSIAATEVENSINRQFKEAFHISEDNLKKDILEPSIATTEVEDSLSKHFKEAFHISNDDFLESNLRYTLPGYTLNILDSIVAFTFHVENVDAKSFVTRKSPLDIWIKFSSVNNKKNVDYYAVNIKFPRNVEFKEPSLDAWDNNTVMQLEFLDSVPEHLHVGNAECSMKKHVLDPLNGQDVTLNLGGFGWVGEEPIVEVIAKGNNETNITLSMYSEGIKVEKTKSIPKKYNSVCSENYDNMVCSSGGSFKGILKYKTSRIGRSLSESSVDFMEYNMSPSYSISSADCIPEESSSLKKTVTFSNVIAKQTFRANSSILGQKSKNQRKKRNKKRAQERRASEGDPDDVSSLEIMSNEEVFEKDDVGDLERRDSGLADTDEGDSDKCDSEKSNMRKVKYPVCESKQGKYMEIQFKNDMIFDLDM